jgi:hypothetical protein
MTRKWWRAAAALAVLVVGSVLSPAFRTGALFAGAVLLYLLPAIIASTRRRPHASTVTAIDLLLGWTGIGWLLALVMALC